MKSKKKASPSALVKADRRPLVAVLLLVIASVATWILFTSPAREEASVAQEELDTATAQLQANQVNLRDLQSGRERSAAALLTRARDLDALLPAAVDKVALVARVDQASRSTGVELMQMNPAEDVVKGNAVASQFDVQVAGTPGQVEQFLRLLGNEQPLMTATTMTTATSESAEGGLETTASLRLQVWSVTNAELQAPNQQQ